MRFQMIWNTGWTGDEKLHLLECAVRIIHDCSHSAPAALAHHDRQEDVSARFDQLFQLNQVKQKQRECSD